MQVSGVDVLSVALLSFYRMRAVLIECDTGHLLAPYRAV